MLYYIIYTNIFIYITILLYYCIIKFIRRSLSICPTLLHSLLKFNYGTKIIEMLEFLTHQQIFLKINFKTFIAFSSLNIFCIYYWKK